MEKYYNINFYCSYKLQFFIFRRMLNLLLAKFLEMEKRLYKSVHFD